MSLLIAARADAEALPHTLPAIVTAIRCCGHPFEVVVALTDAGDGSRGILESGLAGLPARIIDVPPGKFRGLRVAAEAARGSVLVFADADAEPAPDAMHLLCDAVLDGRADVAVPRRQVQTLGPRVPSTRLTAAWARLWHEAVHELRTRDEAFLYRLSGELYAMRKDLFPQRVVAPVIEDAALGSSLRRNGARFRYVPEARTSVLAPSSLRDWFRQKLRTRRGLVQLGRHDPTVWPMQRRLVRLVLAGGGPLPLRVSFAIQEGGLWCAAWMTECTLGPAGGTWRPIRSTKRWGAGVR